MISPPMARSKITSDMEGSLEDEMKRIKADADDKLCNFKDDKLGLSWAKLSSSWDWTLL